MRQKKPHKPKRRLAPGDKPDRTVDHDNPRGIAGPVTRDFSDIIVLPPKEQRAWFRNAPLRRAHWQYDERAKALALISTATSQQEKIDGVVEAACCYSCTLNSSERLPGLVSVLRDAPAPVFWRVLLSQWSKCDDTYASVPELLRLMRSHVAAGHPAENWEAEAALEFRQGLSEMVTIYRGCSRKRVKGVSWTLDLAVAERFARGHRFILVPDPVIVTGTIMRDLILAVITDRKEKEVLIDPRDLESRVIRSMTPTSGLPPTGA